MASITGLHSINFSNGTEELIAVWKNSPMIRSGSQWIKMPGAWITAGTDNYMASFLDHAFGVNGTDANWSYNGTVFSQLTNVNDSPIAKFIYPLNVRLYLFNIKIAGTSYTSRCWFSDLPKNNGITWDLETGSDLVQTASSKVITSAGSVFQSRGIKVGDPILITSGTNAGEYTVQSVDSETQITLTEELAYSTTGSSFWVGGNWFDVKTDDGDSGNGLGFASGELLLYKKSSVHRFNDKDQSQTPIKNMPGTTSPRSIVVASDGYCYHYHPSGIWRTRGIDGEQISDAIVDVIEGVSSSNRDNVIGWETDKTKVKMFLGDVTLRDGDTITKCVAVFNHQTGQFEIESLDKNLTCATTWLHSNVQEVYAGDDSDSVYQLNTGTSFNGNAIPFSVTHHPIFPAGSENLVDFTRLRLYIENGLEVAVMYKLIYKPMQYKEHHWDIDQTWKSLRGSQRGDRSEWFFPEGSRASGVKLQIIESSTGESLLYEKAVLYFSNVSDR